MFHPFIRTLVTRPHLVIDHLGGYVDLAAVQTREALDGVRTRVVLLAGIALFALLGLLLGGVALLLLAVTPPAAMHLPWLLWAVPLAPWVLVAVLWAMLRAQRASRPFDVVREQFDADLALLREASR